MEIKNKASNKLSAHIQQDIIYLMLYYGLTYFLKDPIFYHGDLWLFIKDIALL
jgi:hypothetical protein